MKLYFKLRQKLLILLAVMVLLPACLISVISSVVFSEAFERNIKKAVTDALEVSRSLVNDYCKLIKNLAEYIAASGEIRAAVEGRKIEELALLLRRMREYFSLEIIEVFDPEGKLIIKCDSGAPGIEAFYTPEDSPLLRLALTDYTKTVGLGKAAKGLTLRAIIPLVTEAFQLVGVVSLSFPINNEFADRIKTVTATEVSLFNSEGRKIATTAIDELGVRLLDTTTYLVGEKRYTGSSLPREVYTEEEGIKQKYLVELIRNVPHQYGLIEIVEGGEGGGKLLVGVSVPLLALEGARKSAQRSVIAITVMAILVALFASYIGAGHVTKPVLDLAKGAQEIASGNLAIRIPVKSSDEVGFLSYSFNNMAESLEKSLRELADANRTLDRKLTELGVLYDVSQAINFVSDVNELLKNTLDKVIKALKAHHGSVMLLDDHTDELKLRVVRGISGPIFERVTLRSGEGIAGLVLREARAILVEDCSTHPLFKNAGQFHEEDMPLKTLVCAPLTVSGKAFGVLNVANKMGEESCFNEDDLRLLVLVANQVSLALEKARLYEQAITDGMTRLFIHRYFQARLDEEIIRSRRYGAPTSLILMDIDHFKNFNDTYGHQQGDIVLAGVAQIVLQSIRQNVDIPARYGGEEFAIILPETGIDGAFALAERIRVRVQAKEFPGQETPLKVTVSLGVSSYPEFASDKNTLIKSADVALYASKKNGRNRTTVYGRSVEMLN